MIERPENRPRRQQDDVGIATSEKRRVPNSEWHEDLELAWKTFDSYLRAGAIAFIALQSTVTLSRVPEMIAERARQAEWSGGELPFCDEAGLRQGAYCQINWQKTGPVKLYHWMRDRSGKLYAEVGSQDKKIGVISIRPAAEEELKKYFSAEKPVASGETDVSRRHLTPQDIDTLSDHAKNRKRLGR